MHANQWAGLQIVNPRDESWAVICSDPTAVTEINRFHTSQVNLAFIS